MSDDIDLRHGGAISVDTDALRAVAHGLATVALMFATAADAVRRACCAVLSGGLAQHVDIAAMWAGASRVDGLEERTLAAARGSAVMADAYELVELRARLSAQEAGSAAAIDLQLRIGALIAADPRLDAMAQYLIAAWERDRFAGLDSRLDLAGVVPPLELSPVFAAAALAGSLSGFGTVRPGERLTGTADPVRVRPVAVTAPLGPPTSLADAFRRFPSQDGAQVKVERYTMPGGRPRFVLYARGTASALYGGRDPWDVKSDVRLYARRDTASYEATLAALDEAGAEPGDVVDVYGHSQGGLIAAHLSMESPYDVQVQVTAGSPVEPTLRDDQLLIQLRHTDDPVSALAGGGSPAGTGAPDSLTASRVGDPAPGPQDLAVRTHWLSTYIETAEMVDASSDPRLTALRDSWSELSHAVRIEAIEYRAERIGADG